RLAQRLSGGAIGPFAHSRLMVAAGELQLILAPAAACLAGEQVEKRLRQLADRLGLAGRIIITPETGAAGTGE
ncbi:MAG: hypothetical protein ACKOUM_06885, partial [Sphingopyxis sp.]